MAYFLSPAPVGAQCVFASCDHAKAVTTYVHEFVNRPLKHMCADHKVLVTNVFKVKELS